MTRLRYFLVPAAGVATLVAFWLARQPLDAKALATSGISPALPVDVRGVARVVGYSVREIHAGRVVSRRESDVGFDRSGRLDAVLFDEGQAVAAGDVLARLDARELAAQRRELEARAAQIAARLDLAKATSARRRELHASDHLSSQRLDEAVYEEKALAAELAAARAAVENVDVRLALSEIRAPYAGSISQRYVDEGTVVAPGLPILRLVEDGALEVQIGVPPATAAELRPGSRHSVVIEGQRVEAALRSVLDTVEPDTRTVRAIFDIRRVHPGLRPGALARLALETRVDGEGFWLPISALAESRRGLWSAYVVEAGVAERRQVEVLHAEADRAFVRGTLRDGEQVIVTGVHRLVPGQAVRVAAASPATLATR